ncbi:protein transport protein SEC23 D-like [Lycium barbarum]|uniref:protein transport protein SEC23 D-like n=1 Tax=Lycium barbarum TaxID=112863 RepID=UPI00293E281B|nr:protein transport protein SEC23 D-like [Lycium barbarum]
MNMNGSKSLNGEYMKESSYWAERSLSYVGIRSFSALEPSSLNRAIYALLTSYALLDKQAYPRHSLSRAALITSGSPIFFLDASTNLSVFYASTADPSLPFPPPQDCLLRTTINKLKQERCITPKLSFIKGGQEDAKAF